MANRTDKIMGSAILWLAGAGLGYVLAGLLIPTNWVSSETVFWASLIAGVITGALIYWMSGLSWFPTNTLAWFPLYWAFGSGIALVAGGILIALKLYNFDDLLRFGALFAGFIIGAILTLLFLWEEHRTNP